MLFNGCDIRLPHMNIKFEYLQTGPTAFEKDRKRIS